MVVLVAMVILVWLRSVLSFRSIYVVTDSYLSSPPSSSSSSSALKSALSSNASLSLSSLLKAVYVDSPAKISHVLTQSRTSTQSMRDSMQPTAEQQPDPLASLVRTSNKAVHADDSSTTSVVSPHSTDSTHDQLPYLIIGMPTKARPNVDYLTPTLESIEASAPHNREVHVYVLHPTPNQPHDAFNRAKARWAASASKVRMFFFDEPEREEQLHDPGGAPETKVPTNTPGPRVRRQSRDVATLLKLAANRSQFFLLMEDDFIVCTGAIQLMERIIDKATAFAIDWLTGAGFAFLCGWVGLGWLLVW